MLRGRAPAGSSFSLHFHSGFTTWNKASGSGQPRVKFPTVGVTFASFVRTACQTLSKLNFSLSCLESIVPWGSFPIYASGFSHLYLFAEPIFRIVLWMSGVVSPFTPWTRKCTWASRPHFNFPIPTRPFVGPRRAWWIPAGRNAYTIPHGWDIPGPVPGRLIFRYMPLRAFLRSMYVMVFMLLICFKTEVILENKGSSPGACAFRLSTLGWTYFPSHGSGRNDSWENDTWKRDD